MKLSEMPIFALALNSKFYLNNQNDKMQYISKKNHSMKIEFIQSQQFK